MSGVTGTGYGGVSTYANNFSYRAFGMKQMSYGNNRQLSINYDNRLRMTKWDVSGVIGSDYQYGNYSEKGERVTFAGNPYDHSLDRSYNYDQVGRLFTAYTGVEARNDSGQGWDGGSYGSYAHNYFYDVYGNMTGRGGWGGWNASYSASYTNNRRDGHGYDAAGNLTSDGGQVFTYDVNNKMVSSSWGLSQGYDGDGQRVRKTDVENGTSTYYLRSSVLGGQVICEIGNDGAWQKGYVYMGGQMLAIQQYGTVSYVHQDPVTKGQRMTDIYGGVYTNAVIELDPFGGETSAMSNNRQSHVFTTYERDGAGMDEAGARKYHGWWSRFDQPDPFDGSYNWSDPQ